MSGPGPAGPEPAQDPIDPWDRERQARVRLAAASALANHPAVQRVIADRVAELPKDRQHLDDESVRAWVGETGAAVRRCLDGIPGVRSWPWLVTQILGFSSGAAIRDLHQRSTHPGVPSALMRAVELADATPILEDAVDDSHLTRSLQGMGAPPWYTLVKGRGTNAALRALATAYKTAQEEIRRSSSPAAGRSTRRRDGSIARWVSWWYRADVSREPILAITRDVFDGKTGSRNLVAGRVTEVRGLLQED